MNEHIAKQHENPMFFVFYYRKTFKFSMNEHTAKQHENPVIFVVSFFKDNVHHQNNGERAFRSPQEDSSYDMILVCLCMHGCPCMHGWACSCACVHAHVRKMGNSDMRGNPSAIKFPTHTLNFMICTVQLALHIIKHRYTISYGFGIVSISIGCQEI